MDDDPEREQRTLRELLALMQEHDLERLKVKFGEEIYEIDRGIAGGAALPVTAAPGLVPGEGPEMPATVSPHVKRVAAPLTGVFYRSSSPDSEPFVDVGDRVEAGDVLCILEAMKLFNEIQSDYAGTVTRILPENGELVSQGAELFWIEP